MIYRRLFNKIVVALLLSMIVGWIIYILWGHELIETVYKSQGNSLFKGIMAGRDVTRLQDYYYAADTLLMNITGRSLVVLFVLAALLNSPLGTLVSTLSFLATSLAMFTVFEAFPFLIGPLHLDIFPYFAHKNTYLRDPVLTYTEKPHNYQVTHVFRGHAYSPVYGIEVAPATMEWKTDGEGFRNDRTPTSADVVVMGDSYIEYGLTAADTFGKRLEAKLTGLKVANLGKSGYNPFQYLEVFKRFGIKKKPKYALFCFYEGNDIDEMAAFMKWQRGRSDYNLAYTLASKTFLQRYGVALQEVIRSVRATTFTSAQLALKHVLHMENSIHPDVAVLRFSNGDHEKILFIARLSTASPEEIARSEEGEALRNILVDFKETSRLNDIVPILLYIPTATHIYAEYSTDESGTSWLKERRTQILAKNNTETAVRRLSQEVQIAFVSLVPIFERAASASQLLYYPTDSHWNSDGRELAAQFVADYLQPKTVAVTKPPLRRAKLLTAPKQETQSLP